MYTCANTFSAKLYQSYGIHYLSCLLRSAAIHYNEDRGSPRNGQDFLSRSLCFAINSLFPPILIFNCDVIEFYPPYIRHNASTSSIIQTYHAKSTSNIMVTPVFSYFIFKFSDGILNFEDVFHEENSVFFHLFSYFQGFV